MSILKWLAEWSRTQRTEAVVWIDQRSKPIVVRAGTSEEASRVAFPQWLLTKLEDPNERMELWHNHPEGEDGPSIAVPGAEDVATATLRGVTRVGTVDDEERWIRIEGKKQKGVSWRGARAWVGEARRIAQLEVLMRNAPAANAEAEHARMLMVTEAVLGAALAGGLLVRAEGLSETGKASGVGLARATNRMKGTPQEVSAKMTKAGDDEGTLGQSTARVDETDEEMERWRAPQQTYWEM